MPYPKKLAESPQNIVQSYYSHQNSSGRTAKERILMKEKKPVKNPAYRETKKHSDAMFAFNIYPCAIPVDFRFVPLHWQDSAEIIYIKRGSGIVQIDFHTYSAWQGDLFLALPGHLHSLRGITGQRMEYENIIFDMSFLGSHSLDLCSQKYLQPLENGTISLPSYIGTDFPYYAQAAACLDAADRLCERKPTGYELGVKGQLLLFFSVLLSRAQTTEVYDIDQKNIQKLKCVVARIEQDYDKKISVADMAAECGYSASHFMRWFKESTGTSFSAYLIEFRLEKAAHALLTGTDSILQIAQQNGFDNLSNFHRLFKKKFGITPYQFRNQKF